MTRMDTRTDELAAMVADSPLPLLKLSTGGRLLYANAASLPLLQCWDAELGADLSRWCMDKIETVLAGCPTVSWEEQTDGRSLYLTMCKSTRRDCVNLYGADITDYKRLLGEYTRARDAAENANRAKSLFLSRMSHEIRTPLNNIMGLLHLVKHNKDTDKQRSYLHNIEKASRHLMTLVSNILDLSRIEAGKIELACEDFDLEKILGNAIGVVAPQAAEKGLDIRLELDYDIPQLLRGDPVHLSQVLVNLLSNALKFTPANYWIKLSTRLLSHEQDNIRVEFSVTDCGIGIDMTKASQIFEPFEQADGTIAQRFGGSGLGLSISRHIVELMGGSIHVDSVPSHGSTFAFDVLLQAGSALTDVLPVWEFAGKNVLIAAGDKYNRSYLLDMMSRKGAVAQACASGHETLKRVLDATAKQQQLDLVLVGRKINDMRPLKITNLIRQMDAKCRILLMTNPLEWEQLSAQAREAGVEGHIQLPVLPSALQEVLSRCEAPSSGADDGWVSGAIFEGKHVLIAEDNDLSRLMMEGVLSSTGIKITFAENGLQAVSRVVYEMQHYDLILMDLQMPEMDGLEAARIIRNRRKDVYIPIIALTANAFADDMKTSLESGMDGFLAKPLDIPELLETMRKVFDGKAQPDGEPDTAAPAAPKEPSLDAPGGLKRLMGNRSLYRRMLTRTLEDTTAEDIRKHFAAGDHESATRAMHTLKGTAATLGLIDVSSYAALMESSMKLGEVQAALAMLPQLQNKLLAARQSIRLYLSGADPA